MKDLKVDGDWCDLIRTIKNRVTSGIKKHSAGSKKQYRGQIKAGFRKEWRVLCKGVKNCLSLNVHKTFSMCGTSDFEEGIVLRLIANGGKVLPTDIEMVKGSKGPIMEFTDYSANNQWKNLVSSNVISARFPHAFIGAKVGIIFDRLGPVSDGKSNIIATGCPNDMWAPTRYGNKDWLGLTAPGLEQSYSKPGGEKDVYRKIGVLLSRDVELPGPGKTICDNREQMRFNSSFFKSRPEIKAGAIATRNGTPSDTYLGPILSGKKNQYRVKDDAALKSYAINAGIKKLKTNPNHPKIARYNEVIVYINSANIHQIALLDLKKIHVEKAQEAAALFKDKFNRKIDIVYVDTKSNIVVNL